MIEVRQENRVLHVALNRPEKRNALNLALCRELVTALEHANNDVSVGSILLTGNGKAFCAGMDLSEVLGADQTELDMIHERLFTAGYRLCKPIVAAVHGPALAGGTGLAANAHILIASEDARFGLTEIRIGLWPILIFRAVKAAVGERRAVELAMTGRWFTGRQALEYGLVHEVSESPLERAREIASEVSQLSGEALTLGLDYVNQTRDKSWEESGKIGSQIRGKLLQSPGFAAGVERALAGMRKP